MAEPKDGGPAFPHDGQSNYTGGMSLRDYFAAKALAGLMDGTGPENDGQARSWATVCYKLADAMLAARAPKEKS